jgi:hypothetical protein
VNSQPNRQLWLPLVVKGELGTCDLSAETPTETWGIMERIVAPENLRAAYRRTDGLPARLEGVLPNRDGQE